MDTARFQVALGQSPRGVRERDTVHPCAAPLSALPERFTRAMPHLLLRWASSREASLQWGTPPVKAVLVSPFA
jgi:hypothetical protein